MEDFIQSELQPTDDCGICSEGWSYDHIPVALKCRHIFGHQCLLRWLRGGRNNNNTCPFCRHAIYEADQGDSIPFETNSIWSSLCGQSSERLNALVVAIWRNLRSLRDRTPSGNYTVKELLDQCIFPALILASGGRYDSFKDCYSLTAVSYASLGHPDTPQGLAIPLIRLARLMDRCWFSIPNHLATLERTNIVFWKSNACMGLQSDTIDWNFINEASTLDNDRYFPLLHLFTVLISQVIAHHPRAQQWPQRGYERMNLVVERCCSTAVGTAWKGIPSNEFKNRLVIVYEELKRHQGDMNRISLRGNEGEEHIVRGLWQMANWKVKRVEMR
ncbi:hypothetical protein K504DRAFT_365426 [Pleomassaria siparia CBS 279.74]|uniref:RING-type domain-containing protein n=1 Tax=Pleomassaria siparia CBS 279.74 TaxID=1314801 RepID=A0A6G1KQ27_9PLEO|nr:hypothetical protein K504DRAFT_365426 [Pleomassaria siparia CBS 279.74]